MDSWYGQIRKKTGSFSFSWQYLRFLDSARRIEVKFAFYTGWYKQSTVEEKREIAPPTPAQTGETEQRKEELGKSSRIVNISESQC